MVVGVLAAVALPRFANQYDFSLAGTFDQTLAVVRYAQKAAIGAHTPVAVTFGANAVSACFAPSGTCTADVTSPVTGGALAVSGSSSITVSGTSFTFDALGRPSIGPVTVTVASPAQAKTFVVEAETGHAHP